MRPYRCGHYILDLDAVSAISELASKSNSGYLDVRPEVKRTMCEVYFQWGCLNVYLRPTPKQLERANGDHFLAVQEAYDELVKAWTNEPVAITTED